MTVVAVFILAIAFWAQCTLRPLRNASLARGLFFLLFFAQMFAGVKTSYDQYIIWKIGGGISSYLLPPYQDISYFLFYAGTRFIAPALFAFLLALIFLFVMRFVNKKFQNRFFYEDEPYIAVLGILAVGYPALLLYLPIVIFAVLIRALVSGARISAYYVWIPAALLVILVNTVWLSELGIWSGFEW